MDTRSTPCAMLPHPSPRSLTPHFTTLPLKTPLATGIGAKNIVRQVHSIHIVRQKNQIKGRPWVWLEKYRANRGREKKQYSYNGLVMPGGMRLVDDIDMFSVAAFDLSFTASAASSSSIAKDLSAQHDSREHPDTVRQKHQPGTSAPVCNSPCAASGKPSG